MRISSPDRRVRLYHGLPRAVPPHPAGKMHVLSVSFLVTATRLRGGTGANIAYNLGLCGSGQSLVRAWAGFRRVRLAEAHGIGLWRHQDDRRRSHGLLLHQYRLAGQQITAFYPGAMRTRRRCPHQSGDSQRLVLIAPD
jgi:adenosine kinase